MGIDLGTVAHQVGTILLDYTHHKEETKKVFLQQNSFPLLHTPVHWHAYLLVMLFYIAVDKILRLGVKWKTYLYQIQHKNHILICYLYCVQSKFDGARYDCPIPNYLC